MPHGLLGLVPVALAAAVHYPILDEFFLADDFLHMFHFAERAFLESVMVPLGGHLLMTPLSIFYALYEIFGVVPEPFMALSLGTHLLSVFLLYRVIQTFTESSALAFVGASLWGMAPVAKASISWFSVYGQVFIAPCLLWILLDIAKIQAVGGSPRLSQTIRWYVLMLLISESFGVGLAIAASFGITLHLLLPRSKRNNRIALAVGSLALVVPVAYVFHHSLYMMITTEPLQPGVRAGLFMIWRLPSAILRFPEFLSVGVGSLLLGPLVAHATNARITANSELAIALSWAAIAALTLAGSLGVVYASPRRRRILLALILLSAACYASIALGRPWVTATLARYHYIGTLSIALVLCASLGELSGRWPRLGWWGRIAATAWFFALFPQYLQSGQSVTYGPRMRSNYTTARAEILKSIHRAKLDVVYIKNSQFSNARRKMKIPGLAAVFVISFPENTLEGKRVYFEERDQEFRTSVRARPDSRLAELIISPKQGRELRRAARHRRAATASNGAVRARSN
jgi:hypothetical protein